MHTCFSVMALFIFGLWTASSLCPLAAQAPPAPILDGYRADPDTRVFGSAYYIYPTLDKPNWNTTDFSYFFSKDLIHWKNEGVVAHNLSRAKIKA